jgi:hypothetical protein
MQVSLSHVLLPFFAWILPWISDSGSYAEVRTATKSLQAGHYKSKMQDKHTGLWSHLVLVSGGNKVEQCRDAIRLGICLDAIWAEQAGFERRRNTVGVDGRCWAMKFTSIVYREEKDRDREGVQQGSSRLHAASIGPLFFQNQTQKTQLVDPSRLK